MPYILPEKRKPIDDALIWVEPHLKCAGDFNYAITRLVHLYLKQKVSYARINEMVGMLDCCKMELYRKVAGPYEDEKIEQNGDMDVLNVGS